MTNEEKILHLEQKLKNLQMYYAAAIADSVSRYGNEGVLDKITQQKKAEQMKSGSDAATRFGAKEPKQVFEKIQDLYGCASWVCNDTEDGFEAITANCMLCAISKRMGPHSPCQIYCLSPIEAMIKAIMPNINFTVTDTLWSSDKCRISVKFE